MRQTRHADREAGTKEGARKALVPVNYIFVKIFEAGGWGAAKVASAMLRGRPKETMVRRLPLSQCTSYYETKF